MLTAFQIVFTYQILKIALGQTLIALSILLIIITNSTYSLFIHPAVLSLPEAIVYSLGQILHSSLAVNNTIQIIVVFDSTGGGDYFKDFTLIITSTVISEGMLILDLILKAQEKKK